MSLFTRLNSLFLGKGKTEKVIKKIVKKRERRIPPKVSTRALGEAEARAKEIILEAKEEAFKIRKKVGGEREQAQRELNQIQQQIQQKKVEIDRRLGGVEEREKILTRRAQQLEERNKEIQQIKKEQLEKLERAASLTKEEAKKLILAAWEKKLKTEIVRKIKEAEEEAKQVSEEKAREILVEAMQRAATDYVPEYTVSTVKLPDEEMKGRIIGREGRNIRTFEKITGVDVDLDEEGVIRLSCFDSIRREVARVSLERLIANGRIQPSRIEEIVKKTTKDIDRIISRSGEDLCHRLKVYNLPKDVVEVLGRFHYRSSYGQSMISHTLEETKIGVSLACELKVDVNIVRLGCLLHDIGKVITEEEGSHVQVGVDFLRKYDIPKEILDCVAQHHGDEEFTSAEAVLVYTADAISGSRPGARYEDYEDYVSRLKEIEELAKSFSGVKEAYAIQAGRELRVIVDPEKRDDTQTIKLAVDIRDKLRKELTFPGQIKVDVIRELRQTEVAKSRKD